MTDPAFLFYPGDYLRDTQCLSEQVQVAYDRIMCEHMRNICISQKQLNFFTKKLSAHEKEELEMVLTKVDGGFQIQWVAESICKRRDYSESRRKNRSSKSAKTSSTHDKHMEIENEDESINENEIRKTVEFIGITEKWNLTETMVLSYWKAFMIHSKNETYHKKSARTKHFREWLKKQKPTNGTHKQSSSRSSQQTAGLDGLLYGITGNPESST